MLNYNPSTGIVTSTSGGYQSGGLPIRDTYVLVGRGQHGILYEPIVKNEKSRIGVVLIHSGVDYSTLNMCGELAKKGYITFGGQVTDPGSTLDKKLLDVNSAIKFIKTIPGVEKVVIMGHSGGATLMSAYQAVAENGESVFSGDEKIVKCHVGEVLTPADGVMIIDSNWGNGSMTLFSVDPAVVEEGNGLKIDPELDAYNPQNGYDPEGSHYSEAFLRKFFEAQKERNNRIIETALERLHALEAGKGLYSDDEPFIVTGGSQLGPLNKIIPQDTSIFAHTKAEHTLLHQDGSATTEIVHSLRPARQGRNMSSVYGFGAVATTVRGYLSEHAVYAGDDYGMKADGAVGILWDRSYDCTPANIKHVHAPTLFMGMTGGYEYLAAEEIYNNSPAEDKSIAFAEGATHMFTAVSGEYGDTEKVVYDHIDSWLSAGRF